MDSTASWLPAAMIDLAAIDDEGQLEQLVIDHANECRRLGLPYDNELHLPGADFRAKRLARFAAQLFGVPIGQCESTAREAFRRHPRRDVALELVNEFRGRRAIHRHPGSIDNAGKLSRARRRVG